MKVLTYNADDEADNVYLSLLDIVSIAERQIQVSNLDLYASLQLYNDINSNDNNTPARTLRSSDTNLLSVPRVRTCFGSRSFSVAAPTIWNSLPFDIRNSCSIASFRRKLKTFFVFNV